MELSLSERIARELIDAGCLNCGAENSSGYKDELVAETAAIIARQLAAQSQWQPISSAPKDGTHILFGRALPWSSSSNVCIGFWADEHQTDFPDWRTIDGDLIVNTNVWCYWQPLPPAPDAALVAEDRPRQIFDAGFAAGEAEPCQWCRKGGKPWRRDDRYWHEGGVLCSNYEVAATPAPSPAGSLLKTLIVSMCPAHGVLITRDTGHRCEEYKGEEDIRFVRAPAASDVPLDAEEPRCICGVLRYGHHHDTQQDTWTFSLTHNGCEQFRENSNA